MKRFAVFLGFMAAMAGSAQRVYLPANGATSTGTGAGNVVAFPGTVRIPTANVTVLLVGGGAAVTSSGTRLQIGDVGNLYQALDFLLGGNSFMSVDGNGATLNQPLLLNSYFSLNGSAHLTGAQGNGAFILTYSNSAAVGPLCVAVDGSATTTSCTNGSTITLDTSGTPCATATLVSNVLNIPPCSGGGGSVNYTTPTLKHLPIVTATGTPMTLGDSTFSDDAAGGQAAVGDPLNLDGGGSLTAQQADSGHNYGCKSLGLNLSYYNAGAVSDAYTWGCFINSGTAPTSLVTLYGPSSLPLSTVNIGAGLLLAQSPSFQASSTNGNINSLKLVFRGATMNSSGANQLDDWTVQAVPSPTGNQPSTTFTISHTRGTTGQGAVSVPRLVATGNAYFATGLSTNTDVAGELSFSAATTATYTFANSYLVHPECWSRAQFDMGSGNRSWITYSSVTSMTINFATAVTGNVSFGCVGRD